MSYRGKTPRSLELQYIIKLRKILKQTKHIIERDILSVLPSVVAEYALQFRQDSIEDLDAAFNRARAAASEYLSDVSKRVADEIGGSVSKWNSTLINKEITRELKGNAIKKETKRTVAALTKERLKGGDTRPYIKKLKTLQETETKKILIQKHSAFQYKTEPWLRESLKIFSTENASLIQSNNMRLLSETQQMVYSSMQAGERHEEIAKKLFARKKNALGHVSPYRKAETRAAIIARDQVSKLNGDLTRIRQEKTGVKKFIWRTAGDGRVRPSHRSFANNIYTWKSGASGILPGQDVLCRCYAEPVLDI